MPDTITVRKFFDAHCHFRSGEMLQNVLPHTARYCRYAVAMPNLKPQAILTSRDVVRYRSEIYRVLDVSRPVFEPLMTVEIRDDTTPEMVGEAFKVGTVAGKVYPANTTTNSNDGLRDFFSPRITEAFKTMEALGMLLLLHGEVVRPGLLITKREEAFLPTLSKLAENFPRLRIVLEHISTAAGIKAVKQLGKNVAGTITLHHLLLTLNDVLGDGIRPHNACMPVAKDFGDRDALLAAAFSGNENLFLGSDTAPHAKENKECAKGACGVFSAPVLAPMLVKLFERHGALPHLQNFTSTFGARFYSLPLWDDTLTFVEDPWQVPERYGPVVPFLDRQQINWRLA